MTTLEGKVAVVAGGAGGVGEGIVRALLKNGATVVATTRADLKAQKLTEYTRDIAAGELVTLVGNISQEDGAYALQRQITERYRAVDLVVASLGGWWQGLPLTSIDLKTWHQLLQNNLTSHFLAIKTLVPLLKPRTGTYVHINGFSAEQPYPMAGPVAMSGAAQKSLVSTLAEELRPTGITVHELILGPIKTRDRLKHGFDQADWYYAEEIGDYVADLATGKGSFSNQAVHYLLDKKTRAAAMGGP
jgi:NAD(P)-dependent dehydrogenase (short-subunit alcohol dehydrogenase family)